MLRSFEQIDRDARAVDLRRQHLSYRAIAAEMGFAAVSAAYKAVQRGLADTIAETNDEVRRQEVERLDDLARVALQVMVNRHVVVSNGRIMTDPETHQPLLDDAPALAALDRLLKIQERRAKLLGLDAPAKVEVLSLNAIDAEIQRLSAELGVAEVPTEA